MICCCGLAAAISVDPVVASLVNAGPTFRGPSVYFGLLGTALAVPLLPMLPRLGSRLAPILAFAGALLMGWITLFVLVLTDDARWNPKHATDRPAKLLVMALLFALAAADSRWRRRMLWSYMAGWVVFVGFGLFAIATGRAVSVEEGDMTRITVSSLGPNENQQAVLVATGMVILLAEMLRVRGVKLAVYTAALLASAVVFASGASRSGSVALAAGCAVVIVWSLRDGGTSSKRMVLKVVALVVVVAAGIAFLAESNAAFSSAVGVLGRRFEASRREGDLGDRDVLAVRTIQIVSREPWHGVGLDRTSEELGGDPHNGYLKIVAEGGAPAALLLVAGLLLTAVALVRASTRGASTGPAAALVVVMTASAAGQELIRGRFWFFLALVTVGFARAAEGGGATGAGERRASRVGSVAS